MSDLPIHPMADNADAYGRIYDSRTCDVNHELYGPSVDVCAWCGDPECDGIGCIATLDPDYEDDHLAIEQLHAWIRRGRFFEQVERVLDQCENRPVRPKWGAS